MDFSSSDKPIKQLEAIEFALNASSIVAITDKKGDIIHVNDKFCAISQYNREELIGQNHRMLKSDRHDKAFFRQMWKTIANGNTWHGEIKNQRKDGTHYWVDTTIVPFLDEKGTPYQYVSIRHDITALKEMKTQMKQMAFFDSLTSLPNQNYFTQWANESIPSEEIIVFYLDVDRFKFINDHLGHRAGDELLKQISARLKTCMTENDFLCRKGGNEFILVTNKNEEALLEKILMELEAPFHIVGEELFLTSSIGISKGSVCATYTREKWVQYANHALREAKKTEGNSISHYDEKQHRELERLFQLEEAIKTALEYKEFHLAFQPLVSLDNNQVIGVETLLRWSHPLSGNVSPFHFIPLLERTGLMNSVGNWVLEQALLQMKNWQDQGIHLERIAVNVSPIQFNHPLFVQEVKALLEKTNVPAARLELEITEGTILNKQKALETLRSLKSLGIKLSIDDFGTGYSSLSYLKHLPIDTLKIDKSFLDDLDKDGKVIINTIISMAKHLEFTVIAEGIEEKEQLDYLQQQACHIGQGYYFSKPIDAEAISIFLKKNTR